MTMLADMIVSPTIQRERAKARRMGSLFLPEPKWEPAPALVPTPPQVRKYSWPLVVWITLAEAEAYFPEGFEGIERKSRSLHSIANIVKLVGDFYNISNADMLSPRRFKPSTTARQIAMYLAKVCTTKSLPEIGRRIGGKDHTTVLHAFQKISALRQSDSKLDAELIFFERELAAG